MAGLKKCIFWDTKKHRRTIFYHKYSLYRTSFLPSLHFHN